jgi:hypothetical protein
MGIIFFVFFHLIDVLCRLVSFASCRYSFAMPKDIHVKSNLRISSFRNGEVEKNSGRPSHRRLKDCSYDQCF